MVTKVGNEFNLEIFGWEIAWGKKKAEVNELPIRRATNRAAVKEDRV